MFICKLTRVGRFKQGYKDSCENLTFLVSHGILILIWYMYIIYFYFLHMY